MSAFWVAGDIKIVWQITGSKPKRALARLCSLSAFWVAGDIKIVWAVLDSNQRPPQCQCDALPPALTAQTIYNIQFSELRWYRMRYILKSQAKRSLRALDQPKLFTIFNFQYLHLTINKTQKSTAQNIFFTNLIKKQSRKVKKCQIVLILVQ